MEQLLFFVCLAVTSLAGYWLGRRALGFGHVSLAAVLGSALECLGRASSLSSRTSFSRRWQPLPCAP